MTGREKAAAAWAAVLTMAITGYSVWKVLATGVLSWHITRPEFWFMMAELLGVWMILFLIIFLEKTSDRKSWWLVWGKAAVAAGFCWLHEVFLPVILAGLYVGYLMLVGMWFGRRALHRRWSLCWDFLLGCGVTITVFCFLSLVRLGSITALRLWVIGSGALLLWQCFSQMFSGKRIGRVQGRNWGRDNAALAETKAVTKKEAVVGAAMTAAILALLLLQAGRMNLAVDFDSIWYGVRSHVMLDSGNSIYENLGTLGVVYTYPKGLEILVLPLSGLPSYSFPIAFNLWAAGLGLMAAYETGRICMNSKRAMWVPFLMAAVPGIMNMADTAKADLMTWFCQMMMVQAMVRLMKERKILWLIPCMTAGAVSLTMKPTAVVFSTAIAGISLMWLVWEWYGRKETILWYWDKRLWRMLLLSAVALAGVWGRTMKLVGVPVTSIFYQLFQKIGFQVKYPFYASEFPSVGKHMALGEKIRFLALRLYGVLFNPQGEDMSHVIIAWGTVLPVVFLVLWACLRRHPIPEAAGEERSSLEAKTQRQIRSYMAWLLAGLLPVNLVSLYSLSQIDGNYYMMYYALVILTGCIWLDGKKVQCKSIAKALLLPAWCYGVLLCGLTNWAWALGSGGVKVVNQGYYPHVQKEQEKRTMQGSGAIWSILASNPNNRVIALGEHPGVLTFPCWVQSYVDVSGYWGNPEVVANAANFLEYLHFADVDYLYMEKEYVDASVRIYQIVRTLIQEGWLDDVREENGNLILAVQKQTPAQTGVKQNLEVFDSRYIQHP